MVAARWLPLLGLGACYAPPALPLLDEVPIEGPDFIPCAADIPDVRVACVIDGMAFDYERCLADGFRIRLLGARAPVDDECYAAEAEAFLSQILASEQVHLSFDETCLDGEPGRLGYVWAKGDLLDELTGDPRISDLVDEIGEDEEPAVLVNQVAIRLGYARYDPAAIPGQPFFGPRMERAQTDAIAERLGLHGACGSED